MFHKSTTAPMRIRIGRDEIGGFTSLMPVNTATKTAGKQLLGHELTHVVQQRAGQQAVFRLAGVSAPKLARAVGQIVRIDVPDAAGRVVAVEGRLKNVTQDPVSHEWTLTYETIQRAL